MPTRSRHLILLALGAVGALTFALPGVGPTAPTARAADHECNAAGGTSYNDLDREGKPDLVVGVPGEDLGTAADAGRVEVRYGKGTVAGLHLRGAKAGDRFGAAVATFSLDGVDDDGLCHGLLVGMPGRDVDGKADAGAVAAFTGTSSGLVFLGTLTAADVGGTVQAGAHFGAALASGPSNGGDSGDPKAVLYVGAPGYDLPGKVDAGAVSRAVLTGGPDAPLAATGELVDVPGGQSAGDAFGTSIGGNGEVIGAPGRTVGGKAGAGAVYVHLVAGDTYREIDQDTDLVPGTAEAGDAFGATVLAAVVYGESTIAVGAPGESIGAATAAGSVYELRSVGPDSVDATLTYQGHGGLAGTPEAGDRFGSALARGTHGIMIGSPGEDVGSAANAGAVYDVPHEPGQLSAWSQNTAGVPGAAEAGDRFGAALGSVGDPLAGGSLRTVVGAPGENGGAGSIVVGLPTADPTPSKGYVQGTGGSEAGDGFGASATATYPA